MKKAAFIFLFVLLFFSSFVCADELSVYRAKAESGDAFSQLYLGLMYQSGEGVTQDYEQAVYWYSKSAEQGYAYAQFNLALMYDDGTGVTQDYKKAFYWYSKSVEQGYSSEAQNYLGEMYRDGRGVTQNYVQALKWFNIAFVDEDLRFAKTGYVSARENIDNIEKEMSKEQVAKAQRLAREWMEAHLLCKHLGKSGEELNQDISSLVTDGLNPIVQKSLDVVRVIGNESVHPGSIDLNDDKETAVRLFDLVNIICEQMITQPKQVEELYRKLPESKLDAIEKRDKDE